MRTIADQDILGTLADRPDRPRHVDITSLRALAVADPATLTRNHFMFGRCPTGTGTGGPTCMSPQYLRQFGV